MNKNKSMNKLDSSIAKMLKRVDMQNKLTVFLGCLVEALALVAVCVSGLCKRQMELDEKTGVLVLTIALALCVSDLYAPTMGRSLRQGAGFGVGAMLVGFP